MFELYDTLVIFRSADGGTAWLRGGVEAGSEQEARDKALDHKPQYVLANLISVEAMLARDHRCMP